MMLRISNSKLSISQFFEKNLFERIIIYAFVSHFLVKLIFELIFGQWYYIQSQNQQWIFYGLLGLDYLISYRKILNLRITINPMSLLAIVFFVMVFHGIFVGILYHNPPFIILNDTIPILMICLNILRMQSEFERRDIDFKFLCNICAFFAAGACFSGFLAEKIGNPSQPSMGDAKIFIPLFFAAIMISRPFPVKFFIICLLVLILSINDLNRTTVLFFAFTFMSYTLIKFIKNPLYGFILTFTFLLFVSLTLAFLPENSKTYVRITQIQNIDLNERKGSVGERQAEWDAIQMKLSSYGKTAELFGLGFGGQYEVKFTHQYMKEYGHAHYSWAWFNFRYGLSGYFYLSILVFGLIFNGVRSFMFYNDVGLFVALLCLMGIIYLATHVNSVLLLNGIHFLYIRKSQKKTNLSSD